VEEERLGLVTTTRGGPIREYYGTSRPREIMAQRKKFIMEKTKRSETIRWGDSRGPKIHGGVRKRRKIKTGGNKLEEGWGKEQTSNYLKLIEGQRT